MREPLLERHPGASDVAQVERRRRAQEAAEGPPEQRGVVGLPGDLERGTTERGRQRSGPVAKARLALQALAQVCRGVTEAAVLEHPREQLLDRLLRFEVELGTLLVGRQHQPRFQLEHGGDQHEELGRRLEVELAGPVEVVDVGEHDVRDVDLEQVDLALQDQGQEQVERSLEDLEVEIERGGAHGERVVDRTDASGAMTPVMRVRLTVAAALLACAIVAAPARAAYAPPSTPGPPLSVPQATLAAALTCEPGVSHASRAPVLLVPGTGSNPPDNFGWNYEPAFDKLGIPWCAITLPENANGDIQVAGEYVVYAIRTAYRLAGRRIAIVGHSQGGMVPRWALRWWPDTRAMVDDMIGFAPTNHGTTVAKTACQNGCSPADMQQENTSNFIAALNSYQETFKGISYTDVYTHDDEEVQPNSNSNGSSSLHTGDGQITNVAVQDVCPTDTVDHLGVGTYDPVAYALAIDALDHAGPADPARVPQSTCTEGLMPGVNPVTGPGAGLKALADDETSSSETVTTEPPLACYVTASCASQRSVTHQTVCNDRRHFGFRLHAPKGARIVRVAVYVNGRLLRRVHGTRLTTLHLKRLPRGVFTVKIVTTASNGAHRTTVRRYVKCHQTRPKTRRRHRH